MVATRRSSRLQEKSEASITVTTTVATTASDEGENASPLKTPTRLTPTKKSTSDSTKKSPRTSTPRRGRRSLAKEQMKAKEEESDETSEASAEDAVIKREEVAVVTVKQLFTGNKKAAANDDDSEENGLQETEIPQEIPDMDNDEEEQTQSKGNESNDVDMKPSEYSYTVEEEVTEEVIEERGSESEESDESAIQVDESNDSVVQSKEYNEEAVQSEEDEDEILMMDDPEESEEEDSASAEEGDSAKNIGGKDDASEDEEDILAYATMAASGINLSTTKTYSKPNSSATSTTSKASRFNLVPNTLDSGASNYAQYFDFKGKKCSDGAALLAPKRAEEEQQLVKKQMQIINHASRQREESTNKKSVGRKWFDMESNELTPEARRDFALLRMRNYLDPKKFYKTSDHTKKLPKHFQMGVVIEGAHEFKSARLTKKERKQTFTEEIMADSNIQQYTKRVFGQIQAARSGQGKKKKHKKSR